MITVEYATSLVNPDYKHILEFGVWEGNTLRMIKEKLDESYNIFGFDSFEGFPEDWVGTYMKKGHFSTNGAVPNIDGVKIFKGWFEDTILDYLKEADTIGLLHVDCDLYSSTKTIFDNLYPYIKSGTIIVFDEWCYNWNPSCNDHEQKAFYEYVEKYEVKYEFADFHDVSNSIERKIVKIL